MKIPPFATLFGGLVCLPLATSFADEKPGKLLGPDDPLPVIDDLLDPEPSVAVMPAEVSLNGIDQPVLGRSLSDSLIGGLVAQGHVKVISYVEARKVVMPPLRADASPEELAGVIGRRLGAQMVLVPRLVGEDDFYRFTVKEVDAGNYEVTRVFELSHVGDREGIFGFVPLVLSELEKEGKTGEARRKPKRAPVLKIWTWEEFRRDFGEGKAGAERAGDGFPPRAVAVTPQEPEVRRAEKAGASKPDAAAVARAQGRRVAEIVALGKITSVNDAWGFCVIDMTGRRLKPSEELEIRVEETDTVYATLVVTRVEGNKAIADLAEGQSNKRLFPGDVVFGWKIR